MLSISRTGPTPPLRYQTRHHLQLQAAVERLSTSLRVNRAADDAAGLAIGESLLAKARGAQQAARNAQDGINLLATAESALGSIGDILQRLRELAVQAGNGTLAQPQRDVLQAEANQLRAQINAIVTHTEFNTYRLLEGEFQPVGSTVVSTESFNRGSALSVVATPSQEVLAPVVVPNTVSTRFGFATTEQFTTNETLLGWSADDTRVIAQRNGVAYSYAQTGSVGATPAEVPVFRSSVTVGADTYQLFDRLPGMPPVTDGIYVSRNGGPRYKIYGMLDSTGVAASFNSTGTRIAFGAASPTPGQDIHVLAFNPATGTVAGLTSTINRDGDMDGVPTSYTLPGGPAEWYIRADGQIAMTVSVTDRDGSNGSQSRTIAYDPSGTNGYTISADRRTITLHGTALIDSNDLLTVSYQTDDNMATDSDTVYEVRLPNAAEAYALGTAGASMRVTVGGAAINHDPGHTNGWDYDPLTQTVSIYGNVRPLSSSTVQVSYRTDVTGFGGVATTDQDGVYEIRLDPSQIPETYNLGAAGASMQVSVGGTVRAYDPTRTNGWFYDAATNTVSLYGSARPTYNQAVDLRFAQDKGLAATQDGSVQIRLATPADTYDVAANGPTRALRVRVGGVAVNHDPTNGFTYDQATGTVTLHGTARPTAAQSVVIDYVGAGAVDDIYPVAVPGGAASYPGAVAVSKGATPLTQVAATDGSGDGFFISGGTIGLVGTGAPDAGAGPTTYTVSYVSDADNGFALTPPGVPPPPAGVLPEDYVPPLNQTGVDLATLVVTVDGAAVAPDAVNGFLATGTPGPVVGAITTYEGVSVQLNGAARLDAGTHTIAVTYDYVRMDTRTPHDFIFQVGADQDQTTGVTIDPVDVASLGLSVFALRSQAGAQAAIAQADAAISQISGMRGTIGAAVNRLGHAAASASAVEAGSREALSRLRDADVAAEMVALTRSRILADVALAMTAQLQLRERQLVSILV